MIPLSWAAGAAAVAVAVGAAAGWSLRADKCSADQARAELAAAAREGELRQELNEQSANYETLRAKANATSEHRTSTVREIYRQVEVPAGCEPPAAAVGVLDAAVAAASSAATGEPRGGVRGHAGDTETVRRP